MEKINYLEEQIKKLEDENNMLKNKCILIKIYKANYFQTKSKEKNKFCNCCNKNIKYNSYSNHLKSKKHFINNNLIINNDVHNNLDDLEN